MSHAAQIILVCGLVTAFLRFLPFAAFSRRETPPVVAYLSRVLPAATMAMLVVYCLRQVSFASPVTWLPELIASAVTVLSYVWRRSTILSIVGGTVCYMLLVQLVF